MRPGSFTRRGGRSALLLAAALAAPATAGAQIGWVDWAAPVAGQSSGTLFGSMLVNGTTVNVTYTGNAASYQTGAAGETDYWRTPTGGAWAAYDATGAPTGSDMIRLVQPGQHTLTFSSPVSGLFMAFVSIGQAGIEVSYDFGTQFDIVDEGRGWWGDGTMTAVNSNYTLASREGHGVIKFRDGITSLSFTNSPAEDWHSFTVGATTVPEPATVLLLGTGLIAVGAFARRRKTDV